MPEVAFTIRWPDGELQRCMSPSRTITRAVVAGGRYRVDELLRRAREALEAGSERVRERYGFACTAARSRRSASSSAAGARYRGERRGDGRGRCASRRPPRRFAAPERIDGRHEVVVIGGGQAGLAVSCCSSDAGIEHVVLERDRIAQRLARRSAGTRSASSRPTGSARCPGFPYAGRRPATASWSRDEIVEYLEALRDAFSPPVVEGVEVTRP